MDSVREAIQALNPDEAYLVSDRTVEVLLQDGRWLRFTAAEDLKTDGFTAVREIAADVHVDGHSVRLWESVDLPEAHADTAEDCLAQAIRWLPAG